MTDEERIREIMRRELEPLTAETHRLANEVASLNGTVRRHDEEIFGHQDRGTAGLRTQVAEMHDLIVSVRAAARTLAWIISILGVSNIVAIVFAMRNVGQ